MNQKNNTFPKQKIVKIFAVIVLYKLSPSQSPSLKSLLSTLSEVLFSNFQLGLLLWDNTPGGQDPGDLPKDVRYESAPQNPGLACAYNRALEIARVEGYDWLLTLDQDTTLPINYLSRMLELALRFKTIPEVAAIVPQVVDQNRNLSPFRFAAGALPRWFSLGFVGIPSRATYALNSAALLRVSALSEIGGYDPAFPIDVSDINLFHRLHRLGKKVFVAGNIRVNHEFSLFDKEQRMSIERYHSMLLDECAFWDLNMGPLARLERLVRLAARACKESLPPPAKSFRKTTLRELKRRILTSRKQRIAEWTRWSDQRLSQSAGPQIELNTARYEPR